MSFAECHRKPLCTLFFVVRVRLHPFLARSLTPLCCPLTVLNWATGAAEAALHVRCCVNKPTSTSNLSPLKVNKILFWKRKHASVQIDLKSHILYSPRSSLSLALPFTPWLEPCSAQFSHLDGRRALHSDRRAVYQESHQQRHLCVLRGPGIRFNRVPAALRVTKRALPQGKECREYHDVGAEGKWPPGNSRYQIL